MLQAVAAAKLGAEVVMVSTVGYDSFGRDTIKNYSVGVPIYTLFCLSRV
jgi:sugar/nucleoside kinase (ribokinase family)